MVTVTIGSLASEKVVPKMINSVLVGLRARPLLFSQAEISERQVSREVILVASSEEREREQEKKS